jgi:N-acetylmuramoyl-L-alanine amidase/beta-lactamase regulating signal transducer with metallopeptidase domain
MIDFLLKSTISLTVFLGFYHLVLEREKMHQFNRFYLLFSIVISFIIPFLTFEIIQIVPIVQNIEPLNTFITSSAIPENEIQGNSLPIEEKINFIPYVLWSLYTLISSLLLVRFGKNIWKLISKSKSNPNVKYKNANLVLVEEETLPHTFMNSIFINFDDYNNRNIEDELYTHELVHVTQKHTLDILLIELLKVVFWFNPVFILYKKAIQLNHEFLADEEIVKTFNNIPFYQNLLLKKGSNNQTIYLASNLNYSVTKKRLIMMTKSTSKKIAVIKKIAIVPILAGLIYFFCVEVVAQEKIINTNSEEKIAEITDKDKIRDSYYSNVRIILKDLRTNHSINKMYEELSLEEKRSYLSWVPDMIIEKEVPDLLFEKMKTKNMAIWINGKASNKEEIKKYKRTDFSYYTYSFVHKNARSKRFPQEYQYTLYTKKYFDENLKNNHLHFSNDTLKMVISEPEKEWKKVNKILNPKNEADTILWYTKEKEIYNLHINEKKEKKVIVIDAGHGGTDFGATANDFNEKNLTSEIAKKIKKLFSDSDVEIHFTRTDDEFKDLQNRTDFINNLKADLVISLHINYNKNILTNGFEIFISDKNDLIEESKFYGEKLSVKLSKTPLKYRGLKFAPFQILKKSSCPSMVVELGFISNENDRKFIASEKGQTEIAKNILEFISDLNK